MKIIAIILTFNEEIHLERCLINIKNYFNDIYIIDSFSNDKTKEIALKYNVKFLENKFINHAKQFNWALTQIDNDVDWIFRIDADEILTKSLKKELFYKLPRLDSSIKGISLNRYIFFQGKLLKFGGVFPNKIIRIFRKGFGFYENKWMDERLTINGKIISFKSNIIDHNLKPLNWWIKKHNIYSNKEALELFKKNYPLISKDSLNHVKDTNYNLFNLKKIYSLSPLIIRSFLYFLYRYFIRFGFLDGYPGLCFHLLQGFWYRLLVDAKYIELKNKVKENSDLKDSILKVLDIEVSEKEVL